MAVKYVAAFRPESYQPFTDRLEIFSPDGSRSVVCVQARNELPRLKYPSKVDLGKCLPGTTMKAVITVENKGGFGMFYVMRRSEFDAFTVTEHRLREDRVGM
ncbi:hypothetical protein RvY_09963 [Ramazzottius varieornatus]|uniref:Uncharacterized protein n=1 Tax=Ramazzottius varieornatus TaxID=947166 RepID=A0A1D1VDA7_RAMVA|nr:hypothetical protein RvY_09963 [Ramazzottius varieornatus]